MYTVYLDAKDKGARATGMGYSDFIKTFDTICQEHMKDKRAKAFAFIFYDMKHGPVRSALKTARGFEILNAETGKDITLFYLHAAAAESHAGAFNKRFMEALGVEEQIDMPCIVFFRVTDDKIDDINFRSIDKQVDEEYLIVEALRRDIAEYTEDMNSQGNFSALTGVIGWFSVQAFQLALKHFI
ncbi:hypothetical protein WKG86_10250 [Pantoea agglomerans]|uniref:hypothetical protein n=1 Tax=Enterobacter agglomerans TaxID=549 RepID=UPI003C7D3396